MEGFKHKLNEILHRKNALTDLLAKAEDKTGIRRLYIVLGGVALIALWLIAGYGAQFLCNLVGFLYPAYASVKAIESSRADDDTQWLTYWVVYGAFSLVEFFADIFLYWIPLYWFFKCCFLLWCMLPATNGAHSIYHRLIKPFVLKHQQQVDQAIDDAARAINEVALNFVVNSSDVAMEVAAEGTVEALKKST